MVDKVLQEDGLVKKRPTVTQPAFSPAPPPVPIFDIQPALTASKRTAPHHIVFETCFDTQIAQA